MEIIEIFFFFFDMGCFFLDFFLEMGCFLLEMEEKMDFSLFLFEMGYFGLFYFFPLLLPMVVAHSCS